MKYVIDANFLQTKEEGHVYLKNLLELPEYYGNNLDALYDVISEWKDVQIEVLNLTEENKSAKIFIGVLKAAGAAVEVIV